MDTIYEIQRIRQVVMEETTEINIVRILRMVLK